MPFLDKQKCTKKKRGEVARKVPKKEQPKKKEPKKKEPKKKEPKKMSAGQAATKEGKFNSCRLK